MSKTTKELREAVRMAGAEIEFTATFDFVDAVMDALVARAREEALAPVIAAWKLLDREMNSCDYCSDPAVSNAADAVEAALGINGGAK